MFAALRTLSISEKARLVEAISVSAVDGGVGLCTGAVRGTVRGVAGAISGTARAVVGRYRHDVAMAKAWKEVRRHIASYARPDNEGSSLNDVEAAFEAYFTTAGLPSDLAKARGHAHAGAMFMKFWAMPPRAAVAVPASAEPRLSPAS